MRAHVLIASSIAAITFARDAGATDPTDLCIAAHVRAQEQRLGGDLVSARASADACADAECPAIVRDECLAMAKDIDRDIPLLTIVAQNVPAGARVELRVDGIERAFENKPIRLNPGEHQISLSAGLRSVTRPVVVGKGALATLTIDLAPGQTQKIELSTKPAPEASVPIGPIVLGSIGTASLVAFAVAAGLGASQFGELEDTCAPRCSEADKSSVDAKFVVADLSLGVGLASVAGAVIWLTVDLSDADTDVQASARGLTILF